jgi:hypothetical protein
MANPRFPEDVSQSVGRFWVGGDATRMSSGMCRVEPNSLDVELTDPLTAWMQAEQAADRVSLRRAPERADLVIHGLLPFIPQKVTFINARTVARRAMSLPFGDVREDEEPQLHHLQADWCIAGAHVPSSSTKFSEVRVRLSHLELWANQTGIDMRYIYEPSTEVTIKFVPPTDIEVPFVEFSEDATLRLRTVGNLPAPSVWGGQIRTENWLVLDGLSGWTLDETLDRFIRPIQVLLTILAGEQCEILNFEVQVDDEWCPVFSGAIKCDAQRPEANSISMLLNRGQLPLEILASWCGTATLLSPTPHVVAAAVAGTFQTVDAEALALTTTAEGMDRALYPDSRRFTEDEIADAVVDLKASEVASPVRDALISALNLYFHEDSYPTRMKRLATEVSVAAPRCVGVPREWKDTMRKLRNGLAHAIHDSDTSDGDPLLLMHASVRSLRWALQIRMLQVAGIRSELLAEALETLDRFQRDSRLWRHQLTEAEE